jgi:N4-gp56 family major capsid protein
MAVTTINSSPVGSDALKIYNVRKALSYALPKFVYAQFGQQDMMEMREGKSIQWIRFNRLVNGTDGTPNNNDNIGDNPTWSPETLNDQIVTGSLNLYGNGVEYTEFLLNTSYVDDLPDEIRRLVGENAGEAINRFVRNVLYTGTSVYYAGGVASDSLLTTNNYITYADVVNAVAPLEANDAKRITEVGVIDKQNIAGSLPGDGVYVAFISPYVKSRLMRDSNFQQAVQFQKESIFTGHLCTIDGVAFDMTSTALPRTNGGSASSVANVERTVIVGAESYGIPHLTRDMFEIVVTPPGGHGDEYAVRTAVAWKSYYDADILNQLWMTRIESAR